MSSSRLQALNIDLHSLRHLSWLSTCDRSWRIIDLLLGLWYLMHDGCACLQDADLVFIVDLPTLGFPHNSMYRWLDLSNTRVKWSCSSVASFISNSRAILLSCYRNGYVLLSLWLGWVFLARTMDNVLNPFIYLIHWRYLSTLKDTLDVERYNTNSIR